MLFYLQTAEPPVLSQNVFDYERSQEVGDIFCVRWAEVCLSVRNRAEDKQTLSQRAKAEWARQFINLCLEEYAEIEDLLNAITEEILGNK